MKNTQPGGCQPAGSEQLRPGRRLRNFRPDDDAGFEPITRQQRADALPRLRRETQGVDALTFTPDGRVCQLGADLAERYGLALDARLEDAAEESAADDDNANGGQPHDDR